MTIPHVHHDNILKWAKGAQMEYYDYDTDQWIETDNPQWDHEKTLWRAKETVLCTIYINVNENLSTKTKGVIVFQPRYIPTEFKAKVTFIDSVIDEIKLHMPENTTNVNDIMDKLGFPSIRITE
jgi:hypothetical protein